MNWLTNLFKKGFRISKTFDWPGEKGLGKPNFDNKDTRDKPIDEIVDFSKTRRDKNGNTRND